MTTPAERTRAVMETREFLQKLSFSQQAPKAIGKEARWLLGHYVETWLLDLLALAWPSVFAPWVNAHDGARSYLQMLDEMEPSSYLNAPEIVDAERILRVSAARGIETTLSRAAAAWHAYSGRYAAQWMSLPVDDGILFERVWRQLELYGRDDFARGRR